MLRNYESVVIVTATVEQKCRRVALRSAGPLLESVSKHTYDVRTISSRLAGRSRKSRGFFCRAVPNGLSYLSSTVPQLYMSRDAAVTTATDIWDWGGDRVSRTRTVPGRCKHRIHRILP